MSKKALLLSALLIASPSTFADRLVFAVDIIRHGDRTPITSIPTINYHWKEGPGQLTAQGMQQEFDLGVSFRQKYIEQHHLLPEQYEPGTMLVRSTYYDRTLMSAQSLLMGLYPHGTGPSQKDSNLPALPHAFQPIPIFSAPAKYDEIIIQQVSREERNKLDEAYVYSTKEWQDYDESLKEHYPSWSQKLGRPITNLVHLESLADSLFIHQLYRTPMPEGLSQEEIQTIIKAGRWAFMALEKPQPIGRAYSSKLMNNIAGFLKNGHTEHSKLKYVLLSAHDTTIAQALSFLGKPLDTKPPYASNLNFSLYEEDAGYYVVKITFNGTPVLLPACGGNDCELQQFVDLVENT